MIKFPRGYRLRIRFFSLVIFLAAGIFLISQKENLLFHRSFLHPSSITYQSERESKSLENFAILPEPCSQTPSLFMVIGVISRPSAKRTRQAIRATWGSVTKNSTCVKLVFVFGKVLDIALQTSITEEAFAHGDLLQSNAYIDDSYRVSSMITFHFLRWSSIVCADVELTVRMDDDVWLNLQKLYNYMKLRAIPEAHSIYGLLLADNSTVVRDPTKKHFVPREDYEDNFYSPYIAVNLAIFHTWSVKSLLHGSLHEKSTVFLDDVLFTGIVALRLNFSLVNIPGFHPFFENIRNSLCYKKDRIWIHYVKPQEMYTLWNTTCWRVPNLTC